VEALAIAASKHITGAVNLGSGVATVVPELARQLVQRVKSNSTVQHIEIDSFASNVVMDIRRAKTTLGWRPKIALKSGLEDIVQRVLSTDLH
jgi:nucleoside-diphosphate-sugar epimerase